MGLDIRGWLLPKIGLVLNAMGTVCLDKRWPPVKADNFIGPRPHPSHVGLKREEELQLVKVRNASNKGILDI